jgi:hypothetical protein
MLQIRCVADRWGAPVDICIRIAAARGSVAAPDAGYRSRAPWHRSKSQEGFELDVIQRRPGGVLAIGVARLVPRTVDAWRISTRRRSVIGVGGYARPVVLARQPFAHPTMVLEQNGACPA